MDCEYDKIYILDTNIILKDVEYLNQISENKKNLIVIPETVLIELEDKKKLYEEIGFHARSFAKILRKMKTVEKNTSSGCTYILKESDDLSIMIVSKNSKYEAEMIESSKAESNDKRIIETALCIKDKFIEKTKKVVFLTLDSYAATFAEMKDIEVESLHDSKDEKPEFEFFKEIAVNSTLFNGMENAEISKYDENYEPSNYAYAFNSEDGNSQYGIIVNKRVQLIDDSDFNSLAIKPVNLKQKIFCKALLDDAIDLICVDAKAGSGKTLMSFSGAMRLIDKGKYSSIIYVRNSIESIDKGADVGYLSGNDEKFRIYNMALEDTLKFIAKRKLKKSENRDSAEAIDSKVEELRKAYMIETGWPGEMRGRTISDAIVILDEWQNSSRNTTQLLLSRLDASCKAVVIGSNRQIDNLYLSKFDNGLTATLKECTRENAHLQVFAVELEKAVRGKFAEFAEEVFEKKH